MKHFIKEYVNNKFKNNLSESENNSNTVPSNDSDAEFSGLYRRVQKRLENDLWNHAAIMRRLNWEGDDNTNRSLFEKKLKRADNDAGGQYNFTKEELEKIITILDTEGKEKN